MDDLLGRDANHSDMDYGTEYDKNYYSDSGDMDYSNNGYDTSGILNASSNSISIELSPGKAGSRENNASESYGYVSIIYPFTVLKKNRRIVCISLFKTIFFPEIVFAKYM